MDDHRAEVAIAATTERRLNAPFVFEVNHHRVGPAEMRVAMLTGGHLLHLAAGMCAFNNVARLAQDRGIAITDAKVAVEGDFTEDGDSTGVAVDISLSGDAATDVLRQLALDAASESTVLQVLRSPTVVTVNEPTVLGSREGMSG